jgi:DegV family protein with EDD domain
MGRMTVKIVTDTLSDITGGLAEELGVTVIPLYVRFGETIYRDRVEISSEEFYRRLINEGAFPSTTQPTPNDFLEVYKKLSKETEEILVITVSSKLSGTYQSAIQAKQLLKRECRIEVIDSLSVAMGFGLIVIDIAAAVKAGANLDEATALARQAIPRSHLIAYFDTLKYLARGGRIGRAQGLLGSMLSVKPLLTIREGEMAPLTRVRSFSAALDYLYTAVAAIPKIKLLAVEHSTSLDNADKMVAKLGAIYPKEKIYRAVISPVIGTYAGPDAMAISILEAEK